MGFFSRQSSPAQEFRDNLSRGVGYLRCAGGAAARQTADSVSKAREVAGPRVDNASTFLSTSSAMPLSEHSGALVPPSPRMNAPSSIATSQSSAPSSVAVAGKSQSARVSDPDTWPRPPSMGNAAKPVNIIPPMPAFRAEPADEFDDDDDDDILDEPVEIVSAVAAPTAVTAIPVPASTAMQYTVKRPSNQATNTDMSWVNLNASANR